MAENSTNGDHSTRQVVAGIGNFAAATVLWVAGVMTIFQGTCALAGDESTVVGPDYLYHLNSTAWGWIHIVMGVIVAVVALGLFWSRTWARVGAIIIASLSIVSMFIWLPHSPAWSSVVIALDIFVIWAVANWKIPKAQMSRNEAKGAINHSTAQPDWEPPGVLGAFPSSSALHATFGDQPIRLEDGIKDGRYEIRAELPGIDPAEDLNVTMRDGLLTIRAERGVEGVPNGRSEFAYGSFVRSVVLPPEADNNDVSVTYREGILTVSVGLTQVEPAEHRVNVQPGP
jgi:HSP20 family molecular chaperone IbpA